MTVGTAPRRGGVALFRYFAAVYPSRTVVMILAMTAAGAVEAVGVLTFVPLLEALFVEPEGRGAGDFSILFARAFGVFGMEPTVPALLGVVVAAISAKAALLWLAMRQVGFTVARVTSDLRGELVKSAMDAKWEQFVRMPVGQMANAVGSEAYRGAAAYRESCAIIAGVMQVAAYVAVAVIVSWQIALAGVVCGVVFLVVVRRLVSASRDAGQAQTDISKDLITTLTDVMSGLKPLKAMGLQERAMAVINRQIDGLHRALRAEVGAVENMRLVQEPVVAALIALGLWAISGHDAFEFTAVMVMVFVFYRLMSQVNNLQGRLQVVAAGETAFWSLRAQVEEADAAAETASGHRAPPSELGTLRAVGLNRKFGANLVLRGVDWEIRQGEFAALYGPSGVGKTTFVDIVAGLLSPDSGYVEVGGIRLEEIDLLAWRKRIGYVPQEPIVFRDSFLVNVTLGEEGVSEKEVLASLEAAEALEFVEQRGGLHAAVGALSGGQRQRLAIARAIVRQPLLLILDEATAALDSETERAVIETLGKLKAGTTILAVSHQHAVREAADVTAFMQGGKIVGVERAV